MGCVVGYDAIVALQLCLDGQDLKVRKVTTTPEETLKPYMNLTHPEIGLFPQLQHTIALKPGAKPYQAKCQPIPFYRKAGALKEIKLMEEQGIW